MLKEDFQSYSYKNGTTDKFRSHAFCHTISKAYAKDAACYAESKRDIADDGKGHDKRWHGGIAEACEGDSHGERIDARCYGKGQLRLYVAGIEMMVGIIVPE